MVSEEEKEAAKKQRATEYRNYVLVYRITGLGYKTLRRASLFKKAFPETPMAEVPHRFAILVSLILTVITEALVLLSGGAVALEEAFFVVIALGIVFFLTLRQAEMVGRRVVDTLLNKMEPPVHDLQVWESISKNIRGQFSVAAAVALGCIPLEVAMLRQILSQAVSIWPIVAFASVQVWVLCSSAYMGIFSSRSFVDLLKSLELNLYPFDPSRSPALAPIAGLFAGVMFDQAILGVVIVLLVFIVKPTAFTATVGTVILVLIVFMLVGDFVYAQLKLASLVGQAKRKTIAELQDKIKRVYAENSQSAGDPDGGKELSKLLSLYDKVIKSSNFAIDIDSLFTYLSGLIWPLVSILTVNLPVPQGVISNVSKLLGEFSRFVVQSMDSVF